jgi:L,D-transpeptidase ErfK/SrfK
VPAIVAIILVATLHWRNAAAQGSEVVGGLFDHTVQPGDYLAKIAARFGVSIEVIARENHVAAPDLIFAGSTLAIDNRHVVPARRKNGIVLNVAQRLLFLFQDGELRAHYPVGLGRPDWPTPLGRFRIVSKEQDKEWCVPPSIQQEMREQGRPVLETVPPGPDNPLGAHWLGLNRGGIGIHSTIAPASVYQYRSHGCIRLHPDDAAQLYEWVDVGTRVDIIYEPVLLGVGRGGALFAEVNEDAYGQVLDLPESLRQKIQQLGLESSVNWAKVEEVLRLRDGVARRIDAKLP